MAVALLDTNVLFAAASARDDYHEPGRNIVGSIDHGTLPRGVVIDFVAAEILNLTREKLGPNVANDLLDRLVEGVNFDIKHTSQSDFSAAQVIFRRYSELSFVDAVIVAYAGREDIEYLCSFDDDFDRVDSPTRLSTPDNPFDEG